MKSNRTHSHSLFPLALVTLTMGLSGLHIEAADFHVSATHPGFQNHTLAMWKRMAKDGLGGIKFDYSESAWIPTGGFHDPSHTTTTAYRKVFEICREGLGPDAFIHERNLGEYGTPMLDVTAGIIDLQRVWDDFRYHHRCAVVACLEKMIPKPYFIKSTWIEPPRRQGCQVTEKKDHLCKGFYSRISSLFLICYLKFPDVLDALAVQPLRK